MNICVVGAGYVGLVAAVSFASYGHRVVCMDMQSAKVDLINQGISPIAEPGLAKKLNQNLAAGRLKATGDMLEAVADSEVIFVCVETPVNQNGESNLSVLKEAVRQVALAVEPQQHYQVIAIKSTVVPTTTEKVVLPILSENIEKPIGLCMNPEFLREGNALEDFVHPDRVVVGELDARSGDKLATIYKDFQAPILRTSLSTAEMIKHTSNALLATAISFSNEVANICELLPGVDIKEVMEAVHLDQRFAVDYQGERVGAGILSYFMPGCGFGGSCLPKDLNALQTFARDNGYQPPLLEAVGRINNDRSIRLVDMAEYSLGSLTGRRVAILGLAFKPNTDDMRDSPAIPAVEELLNRGALVAAFDPQATESAEDRWGDVDGFYCTSSVNEALTDADAAILITDWPEFKKLPPQTFATLMRQPIVVDGRRTLDNQDDSAWRYMGIGRKWA